MLRVLPATCWLYVQHTGTTAAAAVVYKKSGRLTFLATLKVLAPMLARKEPPPSTTGNIATAAATRAIVDSCGIYTRIDR